MLRNAVTGINIIPTLLLGLVLLYWMVGIVGVLDLDFLELDFDLDLEGADGVNPFYSFALFLNKARLPFGLVISLVVLNFWIIAMLMYFLPIESGGLINGILLVPAMVGGIFITKYETIPLVRVFKWMNMEGKKKSLVIFHLCTLLCDVRDGKLGQAEIERNGASIVINVKAEVDGEVFHKNDAAIVIRKDPNKNLYYINKIKR